MPPQCGPFQSAKCLHFCSTLFPPPALLSGPTRPPGKAKIQRGGTNTCGARLFIFLQESLSGGVVVVVGRITRSGALSPPKPVAWFLPLLKAPQMSSWHMGIYCHKNRKLLLTAWLFVQMRVCFRYSHQPASQLGHLAIIGNSLIMFLFLVCLTLKLISGNTFKIKVL